MTGNARVALQVGAMKGNLKSIPVKYGLYNRGSIFIYDYCHHHFGNLDDLSLNPVCPVCL